MRRQSPLPFAVIAAIFVLLAGCHPQEPFYFHQTKDPTLTHYKGVATEIEYPDVESNSLADVKGAIKPFSIADKQPQDYWDLKLEDVIKIALENNKIIRSIGGQVSPDASIDNILRNPDGVASIYDPAIMESNPRSGVEAALSAFDTQFTTNLFWQKVDSPQNSNGSSSAQVLQGDNATFVTQLQKINATGGTSTIRHNVQYALSNQLSQEYPSDWNVNVEVEARQPLLKGAGVQYNRIAGPGAQPGQYNGVMLARLNMDIALTDFESNVRNLVSDTEKAYWELYFRYRSRDIAKKGLEVALKIWQWTNSLFPNIDDAAAEAQAREQYFLFRSTVEQASASLYESEAKLRYMMGLAATDGRLIRPIDEPTTAKVSFDWYEILSEALVRNVELRRIKFGVKNRELSLIASKNFLLPQLDVDALYRWRGMGNDLLSSGRQSGDFLAANSNAYQSLTSGQFQEWQIGLQFQMPIGFRRELATVRNAELNLSKARAVLREAELELSHTLATAWRTLEDDYQLSNSNFQRLNAAQRNFNAQIATKDLPKFQIENLLQAQRFLADAENNYYRSLVNYNVDIATVHFRKGSLLEYNGVYLAEGPWPGKAYFDARRRARARDAALYLDYGFTQPRVVSQGPYRQFAEKSPQFGGEPATTLPENNAPQPEAVPTPTPEPFDPGYNRKEAQPAPTAPPPPEPVAANSPRLSGEGQLSKNSPLLSGEGQGVRAGSAKPAGRKTFDISSLQLGKLEDNPIEQTSSLQPVNDRESAGKVPQKSSRLQWTDSKQKSTNESNANPSAAESDRPASGWQGVQR